MPLNLFAKPEASFSKNFIILRKKIILRRIYFSCFNQINRGKTLKIQSFDKNDFRRILDK